MVADTGEDLSEAEIMVQERDEDGEWTPGRGEAGGGSGAGARATTAAAAAAAALRRLASVGATDAMRPLAGPLCAAPR